MARRPYLKLYTNDWLANAKLRAATDAERGAWINVLCVLHTGDEYGLVRWPLARLARAALSTLPLLKSLAAQHIVKGCDAGKSAAVTYADADGRTWTILEPQEGPIWYSTRMLSDEHFRLRMIGHGKRGGNPSLNQTLKGEGSGRDIHTAAASYSESVSESKAGELSPLLSRSGAEITPAWTVYEILKEAGLRTTVASAAKCSPEFAIDLLRRARAGGCKPGWIAAALRDEGCLPTATAKGVQW